MIGPSGSGKSLLAFQFIASAVQRGEKAAMFVFEEDLDLLLERSRSVGIDLGSMQAAGGLRIQVVDAAELAPGEFAGAVRAVVDEGCQTVLIDSLNGYHAAMPEEQFLVLHMHELLSYLNRQGVSTFLTLAQHGLIGEQMASPVDVTYLSDTIVLLRYFESAGEIRRAVSVIKKRAGQHERTIREILIDRSGIRIGEPLRQFHGVLRGVPTYMGGEVTAASGSGA